VEAWCGGGEAEAVILCVALAPRQRFGFSAGPGPSAGPGRVLVPAECWSSTGRGQRPLQPGTKTVTEIGTETVTRTVTKTVTETAIVSVTSDRGDARATPVRRRRPL